MHIILSGLLWLLLIGIWKFLPVFLTILAVAAVVAVGYLVVKWAQSPKQQSTRPIPREAVSPTFTISYPLREGVSPAQGRKEFTDAMTSGNLNLAKFSSSKEAPDDYARLRCEVAAMEQAGKPMRLSVSRAVQDGRDLTEARGAQVRAALLRTPMSHEKAIRTRGILQNWNSSVAQDVPTRGLVIMAGPLDQILAGQKNLELRASHNRQLGPVALIRKGSGCIEGVAEIVESIGPLSLDDLYARAKEHQVDAKRIPEVYERGWRFGWRLTNLRLLPYPVPYVHKGMSRVNLDEGAIAELRRLLA